MRHLKGCPLISFSKSRILFRSASTTGVSLLSLLGDDDICTSSFCCLNNEGVDDGELLMIPGSGFISTWAPCG